MLLGILKVLVGKTEKKKIPKKTKVQINKEKLEKERKLWELAEEYNEEE